MKHKRVTNRLALLVLLGIPTFTAIVSQAGPGQGQFTVTAYKESKTKEDYLKDYNISQTPEIIHAEYTVVPKSVKKLRFLEGAVPAKVIIGYVIDDYSNQRKAYFYIVKRKNGEILYESGSLSKSDSIKITRSFQFVNVNYPYPNPSCKVEIIFSDGVKAQDWLDSRYGYQYMQMVHTFTVCNPLDSKF